MFILREKMISNARKFTMIALLVFTANGCATKRFFAATPCKGLDWFEIGRRDGAIGKPVSAFEEHIQECSKGEPPNADLYINGRNAGLVDFCTPQTGLEFGRAGTPYMSVCPEHLEKKFLPSYELGRRQLLEDEANSQRSRRL